MFLTAFILGLLGSFHCVGMCGPIVFALPVNRSSFLSMLGGILSYNTGRLLMYALFGLIFGFVGKGIFIAGYQQVLSVLLGVLIIISVFIPGLAKINRLKGIINAGTSKLRTVLGGLFKRGGTGSLFGIGLLNGLLPCGLVYLGVAGAIATGDGWHGSFFMFAFGLGTVPAMLSIAFISHNISLQTRLKMRKVVPVFIVSMGLMLILRGMNLGIPYFSPKISGEKIECHKCCKE